jgi:cyclohexadieny/prephenate dehydrogenase
MKLPKNIAFVGFGLIASSLARALKQRDCDMHITVYDISPPVRRVAMDLNLADTVVDDISLIHDVDVVVLAVPMLAFADILPKLSVSDRTIITDVGSVKGVVENLVRQHVPHLLPRFILGHPIAGTENSGPASGFAELFRNRWYLITPMKENKPSCIDIIKHLWQVTGAKVEMMSVAHHDMILAITSHIPHLIAYTIVDTAVTLQDDLRSEVIKYAASGFRDFTRIASSDPTMWRDIFMTNGQAVLEMLNRFTDDLNILKIAIENGDAETLFNRFSAARSIRRDVMMAEVGGGG